MKSETARPASRLTYVFRAYPTAQQIAALEMHLSEAARLYNAALQERRDAWRVARKSVTYAEQTAQLTQVRRAGDISIASYTIAADVLRRVDYAFAAFFRRVKAGQKPGYPRFRSAARYDSISSEFGKGARWSPDGRRVIVYGIGAVKVKRHREIDGEERTLTLRRRAGRWYAQVGVRTSPQPLPPSDACIGVDMGLASFLTTSDGEAIENPRHERSAARAVRVARRAVGRRRKDSVRRAKAVRRLQRAVEAVRARRADFHHKVSRALVSRNGFIAVEELNVKGLAGTRLARSIHDAGWSSFIDKLSAKAESAGRTLVKVSARGTSQECPCGAPVPKLLSERWHECGSCGLSVSRDHAAALNILARGQRVQTLSLAVAGLV